MERNDLYQNIMTTIILAILIVLAFFLLKPILLSIIVGIILAFVFTPLYNIVHKKIKSKNLSAGLVCTSLVVIILLPLAFLVPVIIDQSIKLYVASQNLDFINILENTFPSLFISEEFSAQIGSALSSFITKATNNLMGSLSDFILNLPVLALQFVVVLFTFFFVMRDREDFLGYVKSLLPFTQDIKDKLIKSTRDITASVIYGQIIIGMAQGLVAGLGFIIFGVPNGLLLTILAMVAGIFPIIGPAIVWIPVVIYFLLVGDSLGIVIGITIFGLISGVIDNFLRPIIVSKRTKMNSLLVLIGMIGGLFLFGVLGLILGPLIIAYLLILLEIYRNKKLSGLLIKKEE